MCINIGKSIFTNEICEYAENRRRSDMRKARLLIALSGVAMASVIAGSIYVFERFAEVFRLSEAGFVNTLLILLGMALVAAMVFAAAGTLASLIVFVSTMWRCRAREDGALEYDPRHLYWRIMRRFWEESWTNPISLCKMWRLTVYSAFVCGIYLSSVFTIGIMASCAIMGGVAVLWKIFHPMLAFSGFVGTILLLAWAPAWISIKSEKWGRWAKAAGAIILLAGLAVIIVGGIYVLATGPRQELTKLGQALAAVALTFGVVLVVRRLVLAAAKTAHWKRILGVKEGLCPYLYEQTNAKF